MALSPKQELFIEEYLKCRNATEAARRVGYAHANKQGPRLLVNVGISEEIKRRTKERAMEVDELLSRLADEARGSMEDFVSFSYGPYPDFTLDLAKARERNVLHLIHELSYDRRGMPKIKLYSALEAQKVLAQLSAGAPTGTEADPIHVKYIKEIRPSAIE